MAQIPNHISYTLIHNLSDDADNIEPAKNNSDQLENVFDSTQNSDVTTSQKANMVKPPKNIVRKHVVARRKKYHLKCHSRKHIKRAKNAKKYHLKRRSRKHTKRVKNTENRTEIRRKIFKKI